MSKFTVKSTLKHDGKPVPLGAVIELDDNDENATYLRDAGVLEDAADDAKVTVKKSAAKKDDGSQVPPKDPVK
ncbi:hypothetical protein [Dyella terrae]|uniref:hypothetical protein n=1 Tax=Dyella terrae TaxID=522259 RepID=UPI001EFE2DAE|nr:hypothetical protein [Dyella terrae]ULU26597.1 hypothetical protein DYST_03543 [Dyella terrae]